MLTQEYLRSILDYNPKTGVFTWLVSRGPVKAGRVANCNISDTKGVEYKSIMIDGKTYLQHRLAWLYVTGEMPELMIDHINGDTKDNRFFNLRHVSNMENCRNQKRRNNNTSGVTGVRWFKSSGKWGANINHGGRTIHLGLFESLDDAATARKRAEEKYKYHENHDR